MSETLNLKHTLILLDDARAMLEDLDGAPLNVDGDNNKDRMRANSKRSKDLLFAAHLADLVRADIMNQYHRFKGENPPRIIP
jgi:hypothetical protein